MYCFGAVPEVPGPGEYEPNALGETQRQRLATSVSHTFKSRSVRALPWGKEAAADDENGAADGDKAVPGPGAYEPPAAVGTKSKPRAKGAIFGRTTSPRFVDAPADTPTIPEPSILFYLFFFMGQILFLITGIFLLAKEIFVTKKSPQTTLSIKLVLVSKQIRKLYRISCYINSKYI